MIDFIVPISVYVTIICRLYLYGLFNNITAKPMVDLEAAFTGCIDRIVFLQYMIQQYDLKFTLYTASALVSRPASVVYYQKKIPTSGSQREWFLDEIFTWLRKLVRHSGLDNRFQCYIIYKHGHNKSQYLTQNQDTQARYTDNSSK